MSLTKNILKYFTLASGSNKPFVTLDAAKKTKGEKSYIFTDPVDILKTKKYKDVPKLLKLAEKLSKRYWLAGYIAYETSYALNNGFKIPKKHSDSDLLWFGVFKKPKIQSKPFKFNINKCSPPSFVSVKEGITRDKYISEINRIKTFIKKGDTYQVNFTYNLDVLSNLEGFEFYEYLRQNQPTSYCAYIKTNDNTVMSFSPELFFKTDKDSITVKPMKGTFEKGSKIKKIGKNTKESAENIMIVDLLRNDLGKICKTNTISVKKVFQIEKHPTITQMTSTISGKLSKNAGFFDIINSIFPSGSVTGAPKIRTMQIIKNAEKSTRDVYCGAIGYIAPGNKAVFNVPIRTMEKQNTEKSWRFRVGSGIVWDSVPSKEWLECRAKYRFLNESDFQIFESILWKNGFVYLNEHLSRFKNTAKVFNFNFDICKYKNTIKKIQNSLKQKTSKTYKVKITLNKDGIFKFNCMRLKNTKMPAFAEVKKIDIKKTGEFIFHKTTVKPWYKDAYKILAKNKGFDIIYVNEKGELTEGSRSNLFLNIKGKLYTPPVRCGLLPGVLRHILIRSKKVKEKVLKAEDLLLADNIYMGNSVRGLVGVKISSKSLSSIKKGLK